MYIYYIVMFTGDHTKLLINNAAVQPPEIEHINKLYKLTDYKTVQLLLLVQVQVTFNLNTI